MFSPIGGAYNLLRQVKGNYQSSGPLFDENIKPVMQHLAKASFSTEDKNFLIQELNMKYRGTDDPEESSRRAVLTLSDAFELIAVWDWLKRLHDGSDLDAYADDLSILGNELGKLIRAVDDHPSFTLSGTREISKSVAASYFSHKNACLDYIGQDAEQAYKTRVNLVFKYYLGLAPMYEEN